MHTRHLFLSLSLLCLATPARAELVFFTTGRSLSVKAHRIEGDSLILTLRSGGEVVCDPATIAQIAPDETPYPEPEAEVRAEREEIDRSVRLQPDQGAGVTPYADIIDRAQPGTAWTRAL